MIISDVKRKTLNEEVVARIKQYIIDYGLKAGDRLPTEQAFTTLLGVSRTSVREATRALSFLGIIRSAPKVGLTVGSVDMGRVMEYLGFHLAINHYPAHRLLQARMVIEVGALGEVIPRMREDPSLFARLNGIIDEQARSRNLEGFIRHDLRFHRTLLESSGIEPLVAFNDLLEVFFHRFRRGLKRDDWAMGIRSHRRLVRALGEGDLAAAQRVLRTHLEYHRSGGLEATAR